jgi:hypothetical protein
MSPKITGAPHRRGQVSLRNPERLANQTLGFTAAPGV